jgi:hypothetical protein
LLLVAVVVILGRVFLDRTWLSTLSQYLSVAADLNTSFAHLARIRRRRRHRRITLMLLRV